MGRPGGSRHRILDSAERIVVDRGARHLTLDAVAAHAGVSKGGLLYHFGTREALLQAMVDRRCASFEVRTREMAGTGGPAAALAAYVSVAVKRRANGSVAGALIAAIANDTRLLKPVREHLRRWLPQLDPAAPSFADRAVLWLATEGLWLLELLDLSPLNERQRGEVAARLVELAENGDFGVPAAEPPVRRRGASATKRLPSNVGGAK
jgi:AcrR family transcriptional regulator